MGCEREGESVFSSAFGCEGPFIGFPLSVISVCPMGFVVTRLPEEGIHVEETANSVVLNCDK